MGRLRVPRLAETAKAPPARFANPEATVRTFMAAVKGARLGVALECFAEQSCLVTPDATAVSGRGPIGDLLAQLISQQTQIAIESSGAVVADDLAFVNQRWRIAVGRGSDHAHSWEVVPVLVLRRVRSEWKLAIVAPWGRP
jgi:ketosteroid isomerase-like protein